MTVRHNSRIFLRCFGTLSLIMVLVLTDNLLVAKQIAHAARSANKVSAKTGHVAYGSLPTTFIANAGQLDASVRYEVRSNVGHLFFTPQGITLALTAAANAPTAAQHIKSGVDAAPQTSIAVHVSFDGANPNPVLSGADQLSSIANFFIGSDSTRWHTNVPTYAGVAYHDLYPGIDLSYTGHVGVLKGTYTVAPGADPALIRWRYTGANGAHIDAGSGDLRIELVGGGTLIEHAPTAWQMRDGQQIPVDASYQRMADSSVQFALGRYESTLPLVIDPTLVYSTYLGGSSRDEAFRMAVDDTGSLYVVGLTTSTNFPTTTGSFQQTSPGGGGSNEDAFVVKLNPDGRSLAFSTYLGGRNDSDQGLGLALDSSKNIYIAGSTSSSDFPVVNPIYTSGAGFVTKLNPTGNGLIYSTYMNGYVFPKSIAVDSVGDAYVVGRTVGTFPMTSGAFQTNCIKSSPQQYAFVTKLNAGGTAYTYSTCLSGSSSYSDVNSVSVDDTGSAYVVGATNSNDFPTTVGAFQTTSSTGGGFVTKLNPNGSGLVYSTFLGNADPRYIVLDNAKNAYVVGMASTNFPTTAGAFQTTAPTSANSAFATKLNATGTALVYSTYLGSNTANSESYGAALDANNDLYVVGGTTTGGGFPLVNPLQSTTTGGGVFVSQFNPAGSALLFSTYLGGGMGISVVVDMNGNAYVDGYLSSASLPTVNAFQANYGGGIDDAFIAKISPLDAPTATVTNSPTATATPIDTTTASPTATTTLIATDTASVTASSTTTFTATPTASASPTLTATASFTSSLFPTTTLTSSVTATASYTATRTGTATVAPSSTAINTAMATFTPSATATTTIVVTATATHHKPDTIGVFRPTNATFYLRSSNTQGFADLTVQYGATNSYPVVGDWTGGGITTFGVFDPSNGQFQLRNSNTPGAADETFVLGIAGDQPFAGHWQANAVHDGVGVFRPSNGLIYLKNDLGSGFADYSMVLGIPGDVGVAGDWDGNGISSPGVFRPNIVTFYLSDQVVNGSVFGDHTMTLGYPGDVPFVGDWSAQGHAGVGVFRPSNVYHG